MNLWNVNKWSNDIWNLDGILRVNFFMSAGVENTLEVYAASQMPAW